MDRPDRYMLIIAGTVIFEILILGVIFIKVYLGSSGFHFPLP